MSTFNTSQRKIRTIWRRIQNNINNLKDKDNIDEFEFFTNLLKQQHLKTPLQVFDSGDIIVQPAFSGSTALKGASVGTNVVYQQKIDLQLPEVLLPFVKYSVEVNSIPDTEIHGVTVLDNFEFVGDSIEIRGDGVLIFKFGELPTSNVTIGGSADKVFSDLFFSNNNISFDLSKEVFKGTITRNDDSVKSLNVIQIVTSLITSVGAGNCIGNDNEEIFEVKNLAVGSHKIISLTSTSFTAVGDLTVRTFTDTGSSCDLNTVVTQNVTKTIDFSSLNSYTITLSDGLGEPSIDIKSQEFERNNRWLFWSTLKQRLFSLIVFGSDGDFKEVSPDNFPNTALGDTLPYTSITLKRNIIDPPTIEKEEDEFQSPFRTAREFKSYVRISESFERIPTFSFQLNGAFVFVAPATKTSSITVDFPVYDDIYTVVGTTYSLTTTSHTLLVKETFTGAESDITINIKGYLVNPLYWREQRRYIKNDV